ncbi:type VII secretion target [Actinokineospora sp. HUAS TT18]|uniref:type VII secretion target n=1 Tax=Actinokineospora sp. HUAS TT18 TaxID=3447451 RepID=UPI003F525F42
MFAVDPAELRAYAEYMRGLAGGFDAIKEFTRAEGCATDGFTGLLTVLRPAVDGVGSLYGTTLDFGRDRLTSSADGLDTTAASYETTDDGNASVLDATIGAS